MNDSPAATGVDTAVSTPSEPKTSVKDTVISIAIAFAVAFIFRGFVVEPFMIPTGSMAPTLLGAHMRFNNPETGSDWTVGPWFYGNPLDTQSALPSQGTPSMPVVVHDPVSGQEFRHSGLTRRSGDRIFVLKSLYGFMDPKRFEVAVFKNPTDPKENYIKRLIGVPDEQLAIVDGDIFTRPSSSVTTGEADAWSGDGWTVARKPDRVQRAVWQPVFDSLRTPPAGFVPPISPSNDGWTLSKSRQYTYTGTDPTSLRWDAKARPFTDAGSYNETFPQPFPLKPGVTVAPAPYDGGCWVFPVSDLRVSLRFIPTGTFNSVGTTIITRGHEFAFDVTSAGATLSMKPEGEGAVTVLATAPVAKSVLQAGRVTEIEFWHVDQTLEVWIGNEKIVSAPYNWGPGERIAGSMDRPFEDAVSLEGGPRGAPIFDPVAYTQAQLAIRFTGGPITIDRLAVDRDLHYQSRPRSDGRPGTATHPSTALTLRDDQFFACGDNSAQSLDGRYWLNVDPWVAESIDADVGVVNRELLVGKAFIVYFPAPGNRGRLPIPDAGRLRFIW